MSRFLAGIYDWFMRDSEQACLQAWRGELLRDVRGDVLEVGAGTGANLAHYSDDATVVLAEPDPHMRRRLSARPELLRSAAQRSVVDAAVERLPFDAGRFDVVVSTLVLCSVADPRAAVSELRRVLRPGGHLVLLEHVAADDRDRRRWQGRVEPVWKRLAGNCHLTRDTARTLEDGGFVLDVRRDSMRKALPWVRPTIRGTGRLA